MFGKIKKYFFDKDYILQNLVVITGQKCSLRCKNCANFSPFHSKELDFYDINKIISDIDKISKRIKSFKHIQIQGGDCFLHKDIKKLFDYVLNNEKIEKCTIATNSIILPNKEIIKIIQNPKFTLRLSAYGAVNELNSQKIEEYFSKNNVKYYYHKFANQKGEWSFCGGIDTSKRSEEQTIENYKKCIFKICLTLENGIISRCSRATVAHKLQKFKLKKADYVNMRNPFFAISELKKFFENRTNIKSNGGGIVSACYYCNGTSGKAIPAGEQISIDEYKKLRSIYDR